MEVLKYSDPACPSVGWSDNVGKDSVARNCLAICYPVITTLYAPDAGATENITVMVFTVVLSVSTSTLFHSAADS
jgi:hypothetical protein